MRSDFEQSTYHVRQLSTLTNVQVPCNNAANLILQKGVALNLDTYTQHKQLLLLSVAKASAK